jgi:hypothetical protein
MRAGAFASQSSSYALTQKYNKKTCPGGGLEKGKRETERGALLVFELKI